MEVIAKSKYIRISPRKVRLIADVVRGLKTEEAEKILKGLNKRATQPIFLTLKQGIANAVKNFDLIKESLVIKSLEVGKGPTYKRTRAVSRGYWHPILKRTSHLKMVIEGELRGKEEKEKKKEGKEKKDGTKS
jgi:large subunit ribosomal protein L22